MYSLSAPGARGVDRGDGGALLDAAAKQAYKARLTELYQELAEAEAHHDPGRTERLHAELDALTEELQRAVGLGGRSRRASAPAERARVAVRQAIRRALAGIEASQPALARHLQQSVKTGTVCTYAPPAHGLQVQVESRGAD